MACYQLFFNPAEVKAFSNDTYKEKYLSRKDINTDIVSDRRAQK